MRWTAARVAAALETARVAADDFTGVSTDTRTLAPGALFVALSGERYDGHAFLDAARRAGATGAIVRRGTTPVEGLVFFEVDSPLRALGWLARTRRRELSGPVVAVTGSNGKTATKTMLAAALATRWPTHATRENLNNLIGVPLTILEAPDETQALVVECGANIVGEMGQLRDMVEPSVGVITNVSPAHLSGFGTLAGVLGEKVALLTDVPLGVVGTMPPQLAGAARSAARRVVTAGLSPVADVHPEGWRLDAEGRAEMVFHRATIRLPLVGQHQGENAMLALATAAELGLALEPVAGALARVVLPAGRCQLIRRGDLLIINDTYNANPQSVRAALDIAQHLRGGRQLVVVLGSMLELGQESARLHAGVADAVLAIAPDLIGATGEFVAAFRPHAARLGDRLVTAPAVEELGRALTDRVEGHEVILLKASRGVRLERMIPWLTGETEVGCSTTC